MAEGVWRYVLTVDGREIELSDGEVTLGRSRTSTVRVDHESVSRSHSLLTFEKGHAVVKDLNSSNGTYVGGRRILNETRVSDGDRIQLGAAVIGVRIVAPPLPQVPPPAPPAPAFEVAGVSASFGAAEILDVEPSPVPRSRAEPPPVPVPPEENPQPRRKAPSETRPSFDRPPGRRDGPSGPPGPPPLPDPEGSVDSTGISADELFAEADRRPTQPPVELAGNAIEALRSAASRSVADVGAVNPQTAGARYSSPGPTDVLPPAQMPQAPPAPISAPRGAPQAYAPSPAPPPPPPAPVRAAAPAPVPRARVLSSPEPTLSQIPLGRDSGAAPEPRQNTPPARPDGRRNADRDADRPTAGFGPRFVATLVDAIIMMAIDLLLISPVFLMMFLRGTGSGEPKGVDVTLLAVSGLSALLMMGANFWYVVGGWARSGRTPGKALMGLVIVVPGESGPGIGWGKAIGRFLTMGFLSGIFLVGYLMVLFRKDKLALHDLVAGTRVVQLKK